MFLLSIVKLMISVFLFSCICIQDIPSSATLEYVTDLLYNGFYCFEAMTERDLDQTICGICGVFGEIYLGDGNEKNCCSRKEVKIIISHFLHTASP